MTPEDLRTLPSLPLREGRKERIGQRAGDVFEQTHQRRERVLAIARVTLGVVLTGAAAGYLLWALKIARTFG